MKFAYCEKTVISLHKIEKPWIIEISVAGCRFYAGDPSGLHTPSLARMETREYTGRKPNLEETHERKKISGDDVGIAAYSGDAVHAV